MLAGAVAARESFDQGINNHGKSVEKDADILTTLRCLQKTLQECHGRVSLVDQRIDSIHLKGNSELNLIENKSGFEAIETNDKHEANSESLDTGAKEKLKEFGGTIHDGVEVKTKVEIEYGACSEEIFEKFNLGIHDGGQAQTESDSEFDNEKIFYPRPILFPTPTSVFNDSMNHDKREDHKLLHGISFGQFSPKDKSADVFQDMHKEIDLIHLAEKHANEIFNMCNSKSNPSVFMQSDHNVKLNKNAFWETDNGTENVLQKTDETNSINSDIFENAFYPVKGITDNHTQIAGDCSISYEKSQNNDEKEADITKKPRLRNFALKKNWWAERKKEMNASKKEMVDVEETEIHKDIQKNDGENADISKKPRLRNFAIRKNWWAERNKQMDLNKIEECDTREKQIHTDLHQIGINEVSSIDPVRNKEIKVRFDNHVRIFGDDADNENSVLCEPRSTLNLQNCNALGNGDLKAVRPILKRMNNFDMDEIPEAGGKYPQLDITEHESTESHFDNALSTNAANESIINIKGRPTFEMDENLEIHPLLKDQPKGEEDDINFKNSLMFSHTDEYSLRNTVSEVELQAERIQQKMKYVDLLLDDFRDHFDELHDTITHTTNINSRNPYQMDTYYQNFPKTYQRITDDIKDGWCDDQKSDKNQEDLSNQEGLSNDNPSLSLNKLHQINTDSCRENKVNKTRFKKGKSISKLKSYRALGSVVFLKEHQLLDHRNGQSKGSQWWTSFTVFLMVVMFMLFVCYMVMTVPIITLTMRHNGGQIAF